MAHSETREQRARSRTLISSTSLALAFAFAGCNVYDASLLEASSLGVGGSSTAGSTGGSSGNLGQGGSVVNHAGETSTGGAGAQGGSTSSGAAPGDAGSGPDEGGSDTGGTGGTGGTSAAGGAGAGGTGTGAGGTVNAGGTSTTVGGGGGGTTTNPTLSMIDDMEDGNQYILNLDGRTGYWSTTTSGTGTITPSPTVTMSAISPARGSSTKGLHVTTTGFKTAQIDVDLNRKTARNTYDASAYNAVQFYAKVASGSLTSAHFAMPDMHTDPDGKLCTATGQQCYDHWATDVSFNTEWALYTVKFADLNQFGWGANGQDTLDAAHVYEIQLSWATSAMDLWIDDIAFVKK